MISAPPATPGLHKLELEAKRKLCAQNVLQNLQDNVERKKKLTMPQRGYISQNPARLPVIPIEELGISPYKQKLLRMRVDGFLPKQIAHLENLKEGTIHNHLSQIFHKHDATSLLDFLIKVGWIRVISNTSQPYDLRGD